MIVSLKQYLAADIRRSVIIIACIAVVDRLTHLELFQ